MMVADASALYKLVVEEKHSETVRRIFQKESSMGEPIEVPDLAVSEALNIAWVDYKLKKSITKDAFESAIKNLNKIFDGLDIIPAQSLKDIAVNIAILKNITVYDSMYISASLLKGAPLLSFDNRMRAVATELGITTLQLK